MQILCLKLSQTSEHFFSKGTCIDDISVSNQENSEIIDTHPQENDEKENFNDNIKTDDHITNENCIKECNKTPVKIKKINDKPLKRKRDDFDISSLIQKTNEQKSKIKKH